MIVAGIDGSTTKSGITIMEDSKILSYTLIDLHKETKDPIKRILHMQLEICKFLDQYDIDVIHMEKAFTKANIDTTIKLANLTGGIMLYCAQNDIEFHNPLPSEWRKKVGLQQGKGVKRDVLKAEAMAAVEQEYGIIVNDDVAESCLLARSAFKLPKIEITEDDLWEWI
jgi:Holliday junction resolvasome RuvABC endonuclease subunit